MRKSRKNPSIEGHAFSINTNDEPDADRVRDCIELSDVEEVLDGDTKDPRVTLIPLQRLGDTIKYKVQCKVTSKPFSKARSSLTSERKEKGSKAVKRVVGKVLRLKTNDWGPCFGTSSRTRAY